MLKLYCFDQELRQLVLGEIEKSEVAVRAQMINTLSQAFGPTWYADTQRFTNHRYGHDRTLQKLLDDSGDCIVRTDFLLVNKYPNIDLATMGFPSTLENEALWDG